MNISRRGLNQSRLWIVTGALGLIASGCAGNFKVNSTRAKVSASERVQQELQATADQALGVNISLNHMDAAGLLNPNANQCAGDIQNFYWPTSVEPETGKPLAFANGSKPSFVTAVSTTITDAGTASSWNQAYGCSAASTIANYPSTSCATFDVGPLYGIGSDLSGSIFVGGPSSFAVGVDRLPSSVATAERSPMAPNLTSASERISAFLPLGTNSSLPAQLEGARAAASSGVRAKIVMNGGADGKTWIYDTQNQQWSESTTTPFTADPLKTRYDRSRTNGTYNSVVLPTSKDPIPAAEIHYFPAAYMGFEGLSNEQMSSGLVRTEPPTNVNDEGAVPEKAERIIIGGGSTAYGLNAERTFLDGFWKFNPSFGPDLIDMSGLVRNGGTYVANAAATNIVAQWAEVNPTQPLHSAEQGLLRGAGNVQMAGMALGVHYGQNRQPYLISASGKPATLTDWTPDHDTSDPLNPPLAAPLAFLGGGVSGGGNFNFFYPGTTMAGNFTSTYNINIPGQDSDLGQGMHSLQIGSGPTATQRFVGNGWAPYLGFSPGVAVTPGLTQLSNASGAVLLPWFDANNTRSLAFIGGSNCRDAFLSDGTTCVGGASGVSLNVQPNRFTYVLGLDSGFAPSSGTWSPPTASSTTWFRVSGSPHRPGAAIATGFTSLPNSSSTPLPVSKHSRQLFVAWGGIPTPGTGAVSLENGVGDDSIWYLLPSIYNASSGPMQNWVTTSSTGDRPPRRAYASMTYSQQTGNFYLFGGMDPVTKVASNEIFELRPDCNSTPNTCTFSWRRLQPRGPLPGARFGAGMAEVDYFLGITSDNTLKTCANNSRCHFAIFMQGGSSDGSAQFFGDRFVFDPPRSITEQGSWIRVDNFPPRVNAVMASFKVTDPRNGQTKRAALMYGGELPTNVPERCAQSGARCFNRPALADTWLFDFDEQRWNRAELLGKGVIGWNGNDPTVQATNQWDRRQMFDAARQSTSTVTDRLRDLSRLFPGPRSGAMMFVREKTDRPLPEIYLVGGRDRSGSSVPLSTVYKFCPYSTGEGVASGASDACDAYHESDNPLSQSPRLTAGSAASGRWLFKNAEMPSTPSVPEKRLYLGGAAWDSRRDHGLVWGGVEGSEGVGANSVALADANVWEYTFPTLALNTPNVGLPPNEANATTLGGTWRAIPACGGPAPAGRYGHTMSYDATQDQIIIMGGRDASGNALTQSWSGSFFAAAMPAVWAAQRSTEGDSDCYRWRQISTWGNTVTASSLPATGWFNMPSATLKSQTFGTGYYAMQSEACAGLGPYASQDPQAASQNVGGVTIDLDRSKLAATENLVMHVTYIPMDENSIRGDGEISNWRDRADFRIHLVQNGWSASELQSIFQPRHLAYYQDLVRHDVVVRNFALLGTPGGGVREESIVLPLAGLPSVNRVWIERTSGSGVILGVKLFRMGRR